MFGIDGIEFLIILIVVIVVVGPKDLPKMMRAFGQATARMRRTAAEFRRHFDEAMREAELDDLADTVKQVGKQAGKLDPRKNLTEIFDPIRDVTSDIQASLRGQVTGNNATSARQEPTIAVPEPASDVVTQENKPPQEGVGEAVMPKKPTSSKKKTQAKAAKPRAEAEKALEKSGGVNQ